MVSHIIRTALRFHTAKRRLTGIPKVIVRESYVLRIAFNIQRTVAFCLITAFIIAIEEINVMYPAMTIVRIQRNTVVFTVHHGEVTKLHTCTITHQNTKPVNDGIISYSLKSNVHFRIWLLPLYLKSFRGTSKLIRICNFNHTDDTYRYRSSAIFTVSSIHDALQSGKSLAIYLTSNSFCILSCHIDHLCTCFQCSVVIISTDTLRIVKMGKASTVVCFCCKYIGLDCFIHFLCSIFCYRNNLEFIITGFNAQHIHTCISSVITYQRAIHTQILTTVYRFIIYIVRFGAIFGKGSIPWLKPTAYFLNGNSGKRKRWRKHGQCHQKSF